MLNLKWLYIPFGARRIAAVDTWSVRWFGRTGTFNGDVKPMVEVFPDYDAAFAFAQSLEKAFDLLHISGEKTRVSLGRN